MNKELIKKYKAEFDHWLNGGKLLLKQINLVIPAEWEEFEEDWDWPIDELAVIINDEFVEFRKALAEGKIVQYNFGNYGINRKDFPNTWKDLDLSIGILADRACPDNYRIKQEEPKFKVGDWITDGIEVWQHKENCRVKNQTSWSLWKPKPGEWCWFWDEILKNPVLLQFERFCSTGLYKYETNTKLEYQYCEPFFGILPTELRT